MNSGQLKGFREISLVKVLGKAEMGDNKIKSMVK
jgi:hypothetical protein